MPGPVPDSAIPETRGSIRLPRPFSLFLATSVMIVLAVALRVGIPIYQQRLMTQAIEGFGGRVVTGPAGPEWLGDWMRVHVFGVPHYVDLTDADVTDTEMACISQFIHLEILSLARIFDNSGNVGISHLETLMGLRTLRLKGKRVTDAGIASIQGLTELQILLLDETQISNAGLIHLIRMTRLQHLGLSGTAIDDAGLIHLKVLSELEYLGLAKTRITDAGLGSLSRLTKLRSLDLDRTNVTDAGLVSLTPLTSLEILALSGTKVTDAGLVHLKPLQRLQAVRLHGTAVTDAGIADLREALPNAEIIK